MKANRNINRHIAALALFAAVILHPSSSPAQGSLTPPGAPAPTMKTLAQVEPRTPIDNAPFTISAPGSYYLTTNLTVAGGDAITIAASGVTLDLNGFTIASTAAAPNGNGIMLNNGLSNIAIFNGHITGGVTNNGSDIYSGPGFANGIRYLETEPSSTRVVGVSVSGCCFDGIFVGTDDATVVEACSVRTVGSYGICASTIKNSVAVDCGYRALGGWHISDSRGIGTGGGDGVYGEHALNCMGCSRSGAGVCAVVAQNCYGFSDSSEGVFAHNAQNCYGCTSSGYGLYVYETALNCCGYANSGTGLSAASALNCSGHAGSGTGLSADTAMNCSGDAGIGGTGLSAIIANSCMVVGATNIAYKYNMP
ncbi:MAG: hypothetical protein MUC65_09365 [Pontiellaceae bacterium]|nr:hypothetical protein [Pontiellaceae bacterium]